MRVLLEQEKKYFAFKEDEVKDIIEKTKDETKGKVTKQKVDTKHHKDYGDYYEVTIKETFADSKTVMEGD